MDKCTVSLLQGEVFRIEQLMKTENAKIASRINGWPVVPKFIDYTKANAVSGIIQNSQKYPSISKDTIMKLNRVDDNDQITLGYHVIEFLLWGKTITHLAAAAELLRTMMSLIISLLKEDHNS